MSDLFTVLIPTRDRAETLHSTIASCLAQNADNLRVIVSDNRSIDATRDVVHAFDDPRLQYRRTDRRLSMSGNFEFSLEAVTEGYVMHLGDDDGLIPDAIAHVAGVAKESRALAITSAHATYHWPNSLYEKYRNRLILPVAKGYTMRDALAVARRVVRYREGYPALPGTYSGFVHRSIIDRVKGGGRYYTSITPDSFSGFVDAGVLDRYAFTHRPFALAGLSGRSNGASQVTNNDHAEAARYSQENDLPVHADVVYCKQSLPIVVAEAFLQACDRAPRLRQVGFKLERLCHVALRDASADNYPAVRDAVAIIARRHGVNMTIPEEPTLEQKLARELDRTWLRIRRLRKGYHRIDTAAHGVEDVAGAAQLARQLLGPLDT